MSFPMPKMPDFVESKVGEYKVKDYTRKLLRVFCDHLVEIKKQNNNLNEQDINALFEAYTQSNDEVFHHLYTDAWRHFYKAMYYTYFDGQKYDIIDRLFAVLIQHLLVDNTVEPVVGEKIPSYVAVGLLSGVRFLVGADNYGRLATEATTSAKKLEEDNVHHIMWELIVDSKDIEKIYFDALMYLLQNFNDFDRRFVWMQNMIDSNRPPIGQNDFPWVMSRLDFCALCDAIFQPLKMALESRLDLDRMRTTYGYNNISKIQAILADFDKYYAEQKKLIP